jgi:hypothetical protein
VFADHGSGGSAVSRPTPRARASPSPSPSPAPVDLLLMSDNEPSLLISTAPLDPTPALLPHMSEGGGPMKPAPVPQDGPAVVPVVDREDSTSPVPVKPERHKKKGPPPVPAPYTGPKRTSNEVRTCRWARVIVEWVGVKEGGREGREREGEGGRDSDR